jgi:hypothetical protein
MFKQGFVQPYLKNRSGFAGNEITTSDQVVSRVPFHTKRPILNTIRVIWYQITCLTTNKIPS